jgi:hypothetical protein
MTLREFLLEQIDADERRAIAEVKEARVDFDTGWASPRVLIECQSKRLLVNDYRLLDNLLRIVAMPYKDRAGFDHSWTL